MKNFIIVVALIIGMLFGAFGVVLATSEEHTTITQMEFQDDFEYVRTGDGLTLVLS